MASYHVDDIKPGSLIPAPDAGGCRWKLISRSAQSWCCERCDATITKTPYVNTRVVSRFGPCKPKS